MKSIITLFKKSLSFPVIWVSLIYLLWWLLPFTNQTFSDEIIILIVYFITTILEALLLLSKNKMFTIFLFVVLLCFVLFSCEVILRLILYAPSHQRHLIYLPLIIIFSGYKAYDLFRSHLSQRKILPVLLFIITFPVLAGNIAYPINFFPKIEDKKEFGNFKYYIVWQYDIDYHGYALFYKCEKWSFECNYLPRSLMYIDKIIIDKDRNEVSAINSNVGLDYTDGANPRSYDAFSVKLNDHVYQPSVNDKKGDCGTTDCDVYIYTIYECNLDYTSCDMLPIQYTATFDIWIYLDVNEPTKEINAYNGQDDTLIFTYGEHPVCYVDGCVILDQ